MLYEIKCDKFKSSGRPRPAIRFNEGLNVTLGGSAKDNSVGKSTFMLIIDFAFGGESYTGSEAALHIGDHTVCFAFRFNGKLYRFSRNTVTPNSVEICDNEYHPTESIKLDDFRAKLLNLYGVSLPDMSFRNLVGGFFRIFGKNNASTEKPLDSCGKDSDGKSIERLEKLFNVYAKFEDSRKELEELKKKKDAYLNARKFEFLPSAVTTHKEYAENKQKIGDTETEITDLLNETDRKISEADIQCSNRQNELRAELFSLRQIRNRLKAQLDITNTNTAHGASPTPSDLQILQQFFPEANLRKIETIENFHRKIQKILRDELNDERCRLEALLASTDKEMRAAEEKIRALGELTHLPDHFLEKYTNLTTRLQHLKSQNAAFDTAKQLRETTKEAEKDFADKRRSTLKTIEADLNAEMVRINDFIYNGERKAPVIDLDEGKHYSFQTPDDSGTGTSYKSLIVFDLAIVRLTPVPALAHDSFLFNHIAYSPLEKIMEEYELSGKQIFIAYDNKEAPTPVIQKIIDRSTVLQLNEGGNELFGENWGKK